MGFDPIEGTARKPTGTLPSVKNGYIWFDPIEGTASCSVQYFCKTGIKHTFRSFFENIGESELPRLFWRPPCLMMPIYTGSNTVDSPIPLAPCSTNRRSFFFPVVTSYCVCH